jgi:hypothetical protein
VTRFFGCGTKAIPFPGIGGKKSPNPPMTHQIVLVN